MASKRLGVPTEQLAVADGVVTVRTDPSKKVGYGELIGDRKFNMALSGTAKRKNPRDWKILGTPVPRVDIPAFATGQFGVRAQRASARHGPRRVVRPPTVGAKLMGVDENSVRDVPGLVKVVVKNDFVGVVCEKPWQAIQAATRLKTMDRRRRAATRRSSITLRNQRPTRDTLSVDSLDVDQKLSQATEVVKATTTIRTRCGSIGSSCGGRCRASAPRSGHPHNRLIR